ncbi:MAG: Asp-tRNA(Asn)/Glu-tRNA(Gln) amidotransferase subunit GatC [Candidatus Binatia bacterium]
MKITAEEVDRIAVLARLRLRAEEKSQLIRQLDPILEYMDKLNQLDTAQVEPFTHALDTMNALRADAVTNQPDPEALLANAPDRDGTFFKVPKIIE